MDLFGTTENSAAVNSVPGHSVVAVDRAGRGRYGFLVANRRGPFRLYELGLRGRILDAAEEAGVDLPAGGGGLVSLPLVSERMDIFVSSDVGPNRLFRNAGDGGFEEIAERVGLADVPCHGRGVVALDADDCGYLDLFCGNWMGPHRLFFQRAGGGFEEAAPPELARPCRVRGVVAADFDNDGYDELFLNNFGEPNRLFAWRDEQWRPIDPGDAEEPHGFGTGAAVADIDGDGHLELLVAHGEGAAQPLALYKAAPNDHAWLRVMPLTPAGAPARGAVVRCLAGGRIQTRAICAGSGFLSQMEPVAHFGLGEATSVDWIEVRWPDGGAVTLPAPPVGRLLTVPHPRGR